ncbi:MAG TPA: hypothetical protein PKA19_06285 [Bacillota bacterium]|nr:hypothetical protein [Bacillota bacterium]
MRNLDYLSKYCLERGDSHNGRFKIFIVGKAFFVIASNGMGWEHISVSLKNQSRCPTWDEMNHIKKLFFEPEECVMQLHPPKSEYVNIHPYVLHLWRPILHEIPKPPRILV